MPALANSFQSRPIFIKMPQDISSHLLYIKHLPPRIPPIHLKHIMPHNTPYRLPQIPCPPRRLYHKDRRKPFWTFTISFEEAQAFRKASGGYLRKNQWEDLTVDVYI
jgi:hypothetical protein